MGLQYKKAAARREEGSRGMMKIIDKIIHCIRGRGQNPGNLIIPGFLSWADFNQRLMQERARADRSNTQFTLVVFSFTTPESIKGNHDRFWEILGSVIRERTRKSDIKGWHGKENQRLGIILPETDIEKSSKVISEVEDKFQKTLHLLNFHQIPDLTADVFLYPTGRNQVESASGSAGHLPSESHPRDVSTCPSNQQTA